MDPLTLPDTYTPATPHTPHNNLTPHKLTTWRMIYKDKEVYQLKGAGTIKDIDVSTRRVTGYFAAFDNEDSDRDIFLKGAFARTIREKGPGGANKTFHLLQHDIYKPLGKPDVLREDSKGLYFETEVADTTYGLDTLKLYDAGVYNEHSVGFVTKDKEVHNKGEETQYTEIKEVILYEGSTVTWGANDQTPFSGFKAREGATLTKRMDVLMKAMKDGTFSDDAFALLEIELQQIKTLIDVEQPSEELEHTIDFLGDFRQQINIIN